jgi:hypothetical protein
MKGTPGTGSIASFTYRSHREHAGTGADGAGGMCIVFRSRNRNGIMFPVSWPFAPSTRPSFTSAPDHRLKVLGIPRAVDLDL